MSARSQTQPRANRSRPRKTATPPPEDPIKAAARVLAEERDRRLTACQEEVAEVLKKHGCKLVITRPQIQVTFTD
jgi:hypothetical protein